MVYDMLKNALATGVDLMDCGVLLGHNIGKRVEKAIFVKDQAIDGCSKPLLWSAGRFGEGSTYGNPSLIPFSQVEQ